MRGIKRIVGIDIGSLYTKVVEIEMGGRLQVTGMFFLPTPFLSNTKEIKIDENALCEAIIKRIPLSRLKGSRIGVSIPIFSPIVTTIVLPRMEKKELAIAALIEARRKMIPQPGPNSVFETAFLGEIVEGNIPRYEVLVVREEKEFVTMALELFKEFNLYPYVVTPVCASLGSVFAGKSEYRNKEVAFIDIGYSSMSISITMGRNIIFNRNVSFGCKDIIQGVSGGLGLSYEQAENIILKNGVPDVQFDTKDRVAVAEEIMRQKYEREREGKKTGEVNSLELRMLMEPFLERIVEEVRRTFIYFKERYEKGRYKARNIEKIFFLGGGALINNLVKIVGKRVSPTPEVMDVSKLIELSFEDSQEKEKAALFSGAIALALTTTLKAQETINFLPFEFKKREELAIRRSIFSVVCILVSCGFFLGWLNFWIMSISIKKSLKRINFEIKRMQNAYMEKNKLTAMMKSIEKRNNIVSLLIKKRKDFLPVLSALAIRETDEMFFSYLYLGKPEQKEETQLLAGEEKFSRGVVSLEKKVGNYVMELKVNILGNYEKSYGVAEKLVSDLRKTHYFNNIELISSGPGKIAPIINKNKIKLTEIKWWEFTIKAELNI